MNDKEKLLKETLNFFINSNDFNGIPITNLSSKTKIEYHKTIEILKELVLEEKITVQSSVNPHIIGIGHYKRDAELRILEDAKNNVSKKLENFNSPINISFDSHLVCIYPSTSILRKERDLTEFTHKPYSSELAIAEPHLKPKFFEIEVLEKYFKDPRFSFEFEDYSGKISCKYDESEKPLIENEKDQIFLKTFGLGIDSEKNRVAVVYLRYLSNLTSEHQIYWKSKEIINGCKMLKEYHTNTIEGLCTNSYSVFSAFIEEQKVLNELSKSISKNGIGIFNKTFENEKRPKEFTFFLLPTLENFYNFISLLDKMLSENINYKFFDGEIERFYYENIDENVVERKNKGSIQLFDEWLRKNYTITNEEYYNDIFKPIRKIRRERQSPAHKIKENIYDKSLNKKQMELMSDVHFSIRSLRQIFQDHKNCKNIKIPDWLENGDIKLF